MISKSVKAKRRRYQGFYKHLKNLRLRHVGDGFYTASGVPYVGAVMPKFAPDAVTAFSHALDLLHRMKWICYHSYADDPISMRMGLHLPINNPFNHPLDWRR